MTSLLIALVAAGAATALLCVWGRAILALVHARVDGPDIVVSTLAGALALTLAVVAQVATGRQPSLALTLVAIGATVTLAVWRRGRDVFLDWRASHAIVTGESEPRWSPLAARVLIACTVAALLSAIWIARHAPLEWDAVALWTLKARALDADASFRDHYMARIGSSSQFHQDYPLAVPSVDSWLAQLGSGPVPRAASIAGVLWLAALPALAWSGLRRRAGAPLAAAVGLAMAVHPALRGSAYGGMADLPLAVALLAAVLELARDDATGRWRAALMLALAAAIKNEGMVLALAGLLAMVADAARTGDWRRVRPALLPFALAIPWMLLLRTVGVATRGVGELSATRGAGDLLSIALTERLPVLLAGVVGIVRLPSFFPAVLLFVAGLVVLAARWRRGALPPFAPWLAAILYCGGLLASYLLLVDEPIAWLVETSLQRLTTATVPALTVLGVLGVLWTRDEAPHAGVTTRDD